MRAAETLAGHPISHSAALERVAQEIGYRDWNTASTRLFNLPEVPVQVGDRVSGLYLKKPFEGVVLAVRDIGGGLAFEVTLHFDEPVDVVEFDSFSAYRQRVTANFATDGRTWAKTSDGHPHMRLLFVANGIV